MSYVPYHLVIFGPQGSGKGTQARLLEKEFGLVYVGTGDLLREIASGQDSFGQRVRRTINAGHLIPDATADQLFGRKLGDIPPTVGFVLDGYPRTIAQVDGLKRSLAGLGRLVPPPLFVNLQVPKPELLKRLRLRRAIEQREDETEKAIATRLKLYEEKTKPLLEHAAEWCSLVDINGDQPVEKVFAEIKRKLQGENYAQA